MIIIRLKGDIGMDVNVDVKRLLGNRIKELRRLRKMTQEQLAEKAGVERSRVSKTEIAWTGTSLDTIFLIAEALDVEPYKLLIQRD